MSSYHAAEAVTERVIVISQSEKNSGHCCDFRAIRSAQLASSIPLCHTDV